MTHRMPHGAGLGFRRELLGRTERRRCRRTSTSSNWRRKTGPAWAYARPGICAISPSVIPSSVTACRCRWVARRRSIRHCCSGSGPSWPASASALHRAPVLVRRRSPFYELLPIPLTGDAVRWTAARIRQVQDILGCRIGIENVHLSTGGDERGGVHLGRRRRSRLPAASRGT